MKEKISSGFYIYGDYDNQNIMVFTIELDDDINTEKMEEAINKALLIHPNIKVKLVWENNNFYFEQNDKYFYIRQKEELRIISDTNDYLFGVTVKGKEFVFYLSHVLADGMTIVPFFKSCILFYYSLLGIKEFDETLEQQRKTYSNIKKYQNPYELSILNEIELNKDVIQNDNLKFTNLDESRKQCVATLRVSNNNLNDMSKKFGVRKMFILLAILAESIIQKDQNGNNISSYIAMDMRRALGIKYATHECISHNRLNLGNEVNISLEDRAKAYQKLWDDSEPELKGLEAFRSSYEIVKIFQKEKMSYDAKHNLYKHLCDLQIKNQDTFSFSKMTFISEHEKLKKYVKSLYIYGINLVVDMLFEIHQVGDDECITVTYCEKAEEYIQNIVKKFDDLGILISKKRIEIPAVSIDIKKVLGTSKHNLV